MAQKQSRMPKIFPCPICGQPREIRITKKEKPYFVCDSCGVQVFVRGAQGIGILRTLGSNPEYLRPVLSGKHLAIFRVADLALQIRALEKDIERLSLAEYQDNFSEDDLEAQERSLKARLAPIRAEYESLLDNRANFL
jgi:predicted RNA-binding Zn-ribbon protein involved in translation (DUF1610 family)